MLPEEYFETYRLTQPWELQKQNLEIFGCRHCCLMHSGSGLRLYCGALDKDLLWVIGNSECSSQGPNIASVSYVAYSVDKKSDNSRCPLHAAAHIFTAGKVRWNVFTIYTARQSPVLSYRYRPVDIFPKDRKRPA